MLNTRSGNNNLNWTWFMEAVGRGVTAASHC